MQTRDSQGMERKEQPRDFLLKDEGDEFFRFHQVFQRIQALVL